MIHDKVTPTFDALYYDQAIIGKFLSVLIKLDLVPSDISIILFFHLQTSLVDLPPQLGDYA